MTEKATRQAGRPTRAETAQLDEQIRLAAVEVFIERGFDGVSMEYVARAAGVSKPTLYARFPDKHTLFRVAIRWALENLHWVPPAYDPAGDDLVTSLTAVARSAQARSLDADVSNLMRTVVAESARFPDLVELVVDTMSWEPSIRIVTEILKRFSDRGVISVAEPEIAAEQFIAMVAALPALFSAFGLHRTDREEERRLQHAVSMFLNGVLSR